MPHFAKLSDNVITYVIVADTIEDAEQLIGTPIVEVPVEVTAPGAGWSWDGHQFSPPAAEIAQE